MDSSRTHLTKLPPGFIAVRILQLAFSTAILALSIVAIVFSFSASVEWVTVVSAAVTVIIITWMILATYKFPTAYNYWAVLSMEILLFLVWIDAFVWALGGAFTLGDYYDYSDCYNDYDATTASYTEQCPNDGNNYVVAGNAAISVAAFSACNMLLFLVSMIVVSVFIARHRGAGGHSKIGSPAPVEADPTLLRQSDLELRQQNLALQQQYLALQQQHFELQRNTGVIMPTLAPLAAGQMGQVNVARGMDLEKGVGMGQPRGLEGYYAPVQFGMPQMQQVQQFQPGVASGSGQQEVVGSGKEKEKERNADEMTMSGGVQGVVAETGDEITAAPPLQ